MKTLLPFEKLEIGMVGYDYSGMEEHKMPLVDMGTFETMSTQYPDLIWDDDTWALKEWGLTKETCPVVIVQDTPTWDCRSGLVAYMYGYEGWYVDMET